MRHGCLRIGLLLIASLAGCSREAGQGAAPAPTAESPPDSAAPAAPVEPLLTPPRTAIAPPRTAAAGPPRATTIRVFYGTNRAASGSRQPKAFYGAASAGLSFGFCDVSLPPNHESGELESPRLWRFEFREDPEKHVVLQHVHPLAGPEFITELQRAVWNSIEWRNGNQIIGGDLLLFVHGFNNSFEDAARRTAQIAKDLKFRGPPVMYSWPSVQNGTLRGYQDDSRIVAASEEHFLNFMAGVARESGARRIHVVAHSMGNRLVAETLRKLSYHFGSGQLPRLNQVVLTAPDIDAEYFRTAIAPRIVQTAERITIYSSSRDLALKASSLVNQLGQRRLGEAGKELSVFPDLRSIEVIDASNVDTTLFSLNHTYVGDSASVLNDLADVLSGAAPGERGLQSLMDSLAWRIGGVRQRIQQTSHSIVR